MTASTVLIARANVPRRSLARPVQSWPGLHVQGLCQWPAWQIGSTLPMSPRLAEKEKTAYGQRYSVQWKVQGGSPEGTLAWGCESRQSPSGCWFSGRFKAGAPKAH